jgi:putative DNA primase/helicase
MASLLGEAQRLVVAGLSVIAIRADGTKASLIPWKHYQTQRPSNPELTDWFSRTPVGLAVVGGLVSRSLEILDFDATELFEPWRLIVEELAPGLLQRLPLTRTPTNGRHLYYRCAEIVGNQKLAERLDQYGKPITLIETRGQGGYAIIPPSPPACHPLNKPYVLLRGDLATIPTITREERTILLNAARSFNAYVKPERVVSGNSSRRTHQGTGDRPGDVFNARAEWPAILEPHGWTIVHQRGELRLWKRPGKHERGWSATSGYGKDLLYVFSTNAAPFQAEMAYDKFGAYALLEYRGDLRAAAKALHACGYRGERIDSPNVEVRYGLRTIPAAEVLAWRR